MELVKACDDDGRVEVNPLGFKSGYRVSFPGTVGRLTPEQIAEMLFSGVKICHVEVPLCGERSEEPTPASTSQ